jgi:hypothetical protein
MGDKGKQKSVGFQKLKMKNPAEGRDFSSKNET